MKNHATGPFLLIGLVAVLNAACSTLEPEALQESEPVAVERSSRSQPDTTLEIYMPE